VALQVFVVGLGVVLWSCNTENNWANGGSDADTSVEEGCVDADGDGHGTDCSAGLDCDDSDAFHWDDCPQCLAGPAFGCACEAGAAPVSCYDGAAGTAGVGLCAAGQMSCVAGAWTDCVGQVTPAAVDRCNELDDDCDGEIDEGADGECGDCDPSCVLETLGDEEESPWDPRDDNSEGVGVDEGLGGLVLDSTSINTYTIWVANSVEGTVSKIDVRTYEELGRYYVGTDPSRTSINSLGDAYVGLRNGYGITKVSGLGANCPDTNGDGVITTSSGHDVLPYGQDDCVLWTTALTGCNIIRGVAAQDVFGPDGEIESYVWAGGYDGCLWKLDGDTGVPVINATPAPSYIYGLALDGLGNLWISGNGSPARVGRVDTNRCVDDATCAAEAVCGGEGVGDGCIKQWITPPLPLYGITVDSSQRVWVGGGNVGGGGPCRYDPDEPAGSRWACAGVSTFVGGIAASQERWIWASGTGWSTGEARLAFRIDADTMEWTAISGAEGFSNHGAAVDAEGKVWFINYYENSATVVTPGPTLTEATVSTYVSPVFSGPYTYSDMTGSQLRFVHPARGSYRQIFNGCTGAETEWGNVAIDLFTPERTSVMIRVRTAPTAAELEAATWVVVATIPDGVSPFSITDALAAAAVASGNVLEVELQLATEVTDGSAHVTPVVYDVTVTHRCPEIVG
jgi:hypothetical protein